METFIESINRLVNKENINIYNILQVIFENNFKFSPTDDFKELLIPCNIMTILNESEKDKDKIELLSYKKSLNELIYYLNYTDKKKIKDIDFLNFFTDNIKPFNIADISTVITNIDIQNNLKQGQVKDPTDNTEKHITELNIDKLSDLTQATTLCDELFDLLNKSIKVKEHLDKLDEIFKQTITLPDDKGDITFKQLLEFLSNKSFNFMYINSSFITCCKALSVDTLKFDPEKLDFNFGENLFNDIKSHSNIEKMFNKPDITYEEFFKPEYLNELISDDSKERQKYFDTLYKINQNQQSILENIYNGLINQESVYVQFLLMIIAKTKK